jgi:hypothetical protein
VVPGHSSHFLVPTSHEDLTWEIILSQGKASFKYCWFSGWQTWAYKLNPDLKRASSQPCLLSAGGGENLAHGILREGQYLELCSRRAAIGDPWNWAMPPPTTWGCLANQSASRTFQEWKTQLLTTKVSTSQRLKKALQVEILSSSSIAERSGLSTQLTDLFSIHFKSSSSHRTLRVQSKTGLTLLGVVWCPWSTGQAGPRNQIPSSLQSGEGWE